MRKQERVAAGISVIELIETSFWMGIEKMEWEYDAMMGERELVDAGPDGIEYIEDLAVPLLRYGLGLRDERPKVSAWMEYAKEEFGDAIWQEDVCPGFKVPLTELVRYGVFYDDVTDRFDEGSFDQVVGVFSSGVPFAYTVADDLDAEPVIMRYSSHERDDEEVLMLPRMEERLDDDGRYLIAEDHMEMGETIGYIGQDCIERGAESILAVFGDGNELGIDHDARDVIRIYQEEDTISIGGRREFAYGRPEQLRSMF